MNVKHEQKASKHGKYISMDRNEAYIDNNRKLECCIGQGQNASIAHKRKSFNMLVNLIWATYSISGTGPLIYYNIIKGYDSQEWIT